MVMQTQLRPLSQPVDYDDSELRLIKAWSHEFLHLAMMSAFVGMGCNAAARDNRVSGLRQIEPNLPEAPAIYRAIRQGLLALPQRYAPALLAAQTAYGAVAIAINDFNNVQALHEKAGYVLPQVLEDLANHWRSAAISLQQALDVFDDSGLLRSYSASGASLDTQFPLRIQQLLTTAANGETFLSSGLVVACRGELPDWVERRRWDRQNFNQKCKVTVRGTTYEATIRNISLGGALLSGMPSLIRMTPVTIEIECGRQLQASVMWAREHSLGVTFDQQLLHNDPLVDGTIG